MSLTGAAEERQKKNAAARTTAVTRTPVNLKDRVIDKLATPANLLAAVRDRRSDHNRVQNLRRWILRVTAAG